LPHQPAHRPIPLLSLLLARPPDCCWNNGDTPGVERSGTISSFTVAADNSNREHPMKHWHRATLGVVAGVLLGTAAFAEDWPQWRGPNRDGKVTGFTPPATWPKALAQKWKTTVG